MVSTDETAAPATPDVPTGSERIDPVAEAAIRTASWGFRIAAVLLAIGVVISLVRQQPLQAKLGTIDTIIDETIHFDGPGFIGLAIAAIILTPIMTALTVTIAFYREGDRRFALFSLIVLGILVSSAALSQV